MKKQTFDSRTELDHHLAGNVAALLADDIIARGCATLVVSGGRTPQGFFHALSQTDIAWSKVNITLADERWVDANHADSNEKLVREHLCINQAISARFLSLKNSAPSAELGQAVCAEQLGDLGSFSAVILGMGDDGHTASLFPGTKSLATGLDLSSGLSCLAVQPLDAPHERMSLSLPRLLDCQKLFLHIVGESKAQMLNQVAAGTDASEYPVRAVLQQQTTPIEIYYAG